MTLGPLSYQNWKASQLDEGWGVALEYPLFTDAHIIGNDLHSLGPYRVINTVSTHINRPAMVLRIESHIPYTSPNMDRTSTIDYHGGLEADELAALISLCLGIRLKAGGHNRMYEKGGTPEGRPVAHGFGEDPSFSPLLGKYRSFILNSALGEHELDKAKIIASFPNLLPTEASALVRAARMYQEAVWIVEHSPELSWLMLVSAVETLSNQWRKTVLTPVEKMNLFNPNIEPVLRKYGGDKNDELVTEVAELIAPTVKATETFREFLLRFLPPPPSARSYEYTQVSWESNEMKKSLNVIYNHRSKALHQGQPFPLPMCLPPRKSGENGELDEIPLGLATSARGAVWLAKDVPMLFHIFEYIVRNSILNWWGSTVPET